MFIPDAGSLIQIFYPGSIVSKRFRIRILIFYPSRISDLRNRGQKGTGSRILIRNTACYGTCLPPSRRACCRQFSRRQRRPRPCRGYRWRFRCSPPPSPRTQSKWISNIKNRYEKHFKQRERERGVFDLCRHDRVSQDVSDRSCVMKEIWFRLNSENILLSAELFEKYQFSENRETFQFQSKAKKLRKGKHTSPEAERFRQ